MVTPPRNMSQTAGDFSISELSEDDFPDVRRLQENIVRNIPDKKLFYPAEDEYLRLLLGADATTYGVYFRSDLVAYANVRYPNDGNLFIGSFLGLNKPIAHLISEFEAVAVSEVVRGRGLQKFLIGAIIRKSILKARPLICALVDPRNVPSVRNFISCGMRPRIITELAGGRIRFILFRDLGESDILRWTNIVKLPSQSTEELDKNFRKGYEVFDIEAGDVIHYILGKRLSSTDYIGIVTPYQRNFIFPSVPRCFPY